MKKETKGKKIIRQLQQIFKKSVVEVFYQVLITVIVYDILERRETRRSREGKNSMEKTNSFICCLIDWWLLISRVTRFFIEIYYCYPMSTIVTLHSYGSETDICRGVTIGGAWGHVSNHFLVD